MSGRAVGKAGGGGGGVGPLLDDLDDILTCPICDEMLQTAMCLPCSHAYCSQCIRKSLNFKEECPICRVRSHSRDLANNRLLDEVVARYKKLGPLVRRLLTQPTPAPQPPPTTPPKESNLRTPKRVRGGTKKGANQLPIQLSLADTRVKKRRKLLSKPTQACPICSGPLPDDAALVNAHIDKCLVQHTDSDAASAAQQGGEGEASSRARDEGDAAMAEVISSEDDGEGEAEGVGQEQTERSQEERRANRLKVLQSLGPHHNRKPLVPVHYKSLTTKRLKEILRQHGLPVDGDRLALEKRHREFLMLYNAECDRKDPRPVRVLVNELLQMERSCSAMREGAAIGRVAVCTKAASDKLFARLVAEAARSRKPAPSPLGAGQGESEERGHEAEHSFGSSSEEPEHEDDDEGGDTGRARAEGHETPPCDEPGASPPAASPVPSTPERCCSRNGGKDVSDLAVGVGDCASSNSPVSLNGADGA